MLVSGGIPLRFELEVRLGRNVHLPIWTRDYPQSMTSWRLDKSELGGGEGTQNGPSQGPRMEPEGRKIEVQLNE